MFPIRLWILRQVKEAMPNMKANSDMIVIMVFFLDTFPLNVLFFRPGQRLKGK